MFSKPELIALHHIANGCSDVRSLASKMGISTAAVYKAIKSLREKGILTSDSGIELSHDTVGLRLASVMRYSPNRADILSGNGLDILTSLLEPGTANEVSERTGIPRSTVFRRLDAMMDMGAVWKDGDVYRINDEMWPELRGLLGSVHDRNMVFDPRVKTGSEIFRSNAAGVLYAYPGELEDQRTGFSRFGDYGDPVGLDTVYYTTAKRPLTIQGVFDDAFEIAERTDDYMLRMILVIFYLHHSEEIESPDRFTNVVDRIMAGDRVGSWPTLRDLRDRVPEIGGE